MVPSCFKVAVLAAVVALASADCPPYWTAYLDKCLQIFNKPMTWEEAEDFCMGYSTCEGNQVGHLASITDAGVNNFVLRYKKMIEVQGGPAAKIWIGLNDLTMEGLFEWTSGVNVTYTNWELGQPNNGQGQENCVALPGVNTLDQWDDTNCVQALPFVCELPGVDPNAQQMVCPIF